MKYPKPMTMAVVLAAALAGAAAPFAADWITAPGKEVAASSGRYRRVFEIRDSPSSARLRITGFGAFEVSLNGKRVGEDELKPGFTAAGNRQLFEYEVAPLMRPGTNVLEVLLSGSYWQDLIAGDGEWQRRRNAFAAELEMKSAEGEPVTIATDVRWEVAARSPVVKSGIYEGETYDARLEENGGWSAAVRYAGERPAVCPARAVVRVRGDLAVAAAVPFTVGPGEKRIVDFGRNLAGRESFRVKGPRGAEVTIRHAEVLDRDGRCYYEHLRRAEATTRYTLRGGDGEDFTPRFTYYGFRYVEISATAPVEFLELRHEPLSSVREETCRIETSDEGLNRVIAAAMGSLRSNQLSVPTDCCQRGERLGWLGDACVSAAAANWLWDTREFYAKSFRDQRDVQRDDGCYCSLAPGRGGEMGPDKYGITAWADAGVLLPYALYRHFGDDPALGEHLESMFAYGGWLEKSGGPFPGYWGDWLAFQRTGYGEPRYPYGSDRDTYEFLSAAYRIRDFAALAEMAKARGRDAEAARFAADRDRALSAVIGKFFDDRGRLIRHYVCQTTCAIALEFGIYPDEAAKRQLVEALELNIIRSGRRLMTGILGTQYLLKALSDNGKTALAYDLLLSHACPSWLYMTDRGATTLWERWDGILADGSFNDPRMNSFNHADFACILDWMFRTMAGINPDPENGGFNRVVLAPKPDPRVREVRAEYRSPKGMIKVRSFYDDAGEWHYEYSVPPEMERENRAPRSE